MTPTLPVLGSAAPRLWNDFGHIFYWDQDWSVPLWAAGKREQIFSRQWNGLSGSNAVHPLKYLCPISVPRIEGRESVTVKIGRPIIDATP